MTLSEAKYGQEVQIMCINRELLKKIQPMGFYSGAWLRIIAVGLLGGPVMVQCFHYGVAGENDTYHRDRFDDAKVMISQDVARLIEVE